MRVSPFIRPEKIKIKMHLLKNKRSRANQSHLVAKIKTLKEVSKLITKSKRPHYQPEQKSLPP